MKDAVTPEDHSWLTYILIARISPFSPTPWGTKCGINILRTSSKHQAGGLRPHGSIYRTRSEVQFSLWDPLARRLTKLGAAIQVFSLPLWTPLECHKPCNYVNAPHCRARCPAISWRRCGSEYLYTFHCIGGCNVDLHLALSWFVPTVLSKGTVFTPRRRNCVQLQFGLAPTSNVDCSETVEISYHDWKQRPYAVHAFHISQTHADMCIYHFVLVFNFMGIRTVVFEILQNSFFIKILNDFNVSALTVLTNFLLAISVQVFRLLNKSRSCATSQGFYFALWYCLVNWTDPCGLHPLGSSGFDKSN